MLYFAAILQIISERMLLVLRFKSAKYLERSKLFQKKIQNYKKNGLHPGTLVERDCIARAYRQVLRKLSEQLFFQTFVDSCRSFYATGKLYDKLLGHKTFSGNSGKFNVFDFPFQNIIRKKCSSISAILTSYQANHNSAHEIKKFKVLYACDLVQILSRQTIFVFYSNK